MLPGLMNEIYYSVKNAVDTGRKLNVLYTFNLYPVSTWKRGYYYMPGLKEYFFHRSQIMGPSTKLH